MNFVFDAEDFKNKPRGIVKTTLSLYRACKRLMPELRFIAFARKPLAVELPADFLTVQYKPVMQRDIWRFIMFNAYLSFNRSAFVHFPSNGLIPKLLSDQNVILTLHDVLPIAVSGYFSNEAKKNRYLSRHQNDIDRAKILFTVSEYSKQDIMKYFRVHTEPIVLHNAPTLDQEPGTGQNQRGVGEEYYLYTGGYDRRKGLVPLLRVFLELHRTGRISSRLYLTGTRSNFSEEFALLLKTALEADIVRELGYVSDQDLLSLLRNAQALIYPSSYEGFGMPPLEAMHAGCPVITTRATSIPEICGDAVLYVDPDNLQDFAETIMSFHRNEHLRRDLIARGTEQACRYSWDRTAGVFLEQLLRLNAKT